MPIQKEISNVVEMKVEDKDQLYSKFSTENNKSINLEIVDFIENSFKKFPNKESLKIEIKANSKLSKQEQLEFKEIFKKHYTNRIFQKSKHTNFYYLIAFVFLLVGMAFIVGLNFIRQANISYVFATIMEVVSWVFVWEFVDIICFKIGLDYINKRKLRKILNSEIIFL